MVVDIICGLLLVGMVILGWRSGAIRQVVRLIAIIAVIVGVPFLSPVIRDIVFAESGRGSPGVEVTSMVMAGVIIYVAFALAGWAAVKVLRFVSAALSVMDRAGGAAIGGIKGVVLVYLCAVLVVMMEGPLAERDPDDNFHLRGGWLTGIAGEYNVLAPWQFPELERLHRALIVGELVAEKSGHDIVRDDEDAAEFLRQEQTKDLLEDEELMGWVSTDNYPMTLADARVREVINDPGMTERLQAGDWTGLEASLREAE